jgi:hypothetical protein
MSNPEDGGLPGAQSAHLSGTAGDAAFEDGIQSLLAWCQQLRITSDGRLLGQGELRLLPGGWSVSAGAGEPAGLTGDPGPRQNPPRDGVQLAFDDSGLARSLIQKTIPPVVEPPDLPWGAAAAVLGGAFLLSRLDQGRERQAVEAALRRFHLNPNSGADVLAARAYVWATNFGPLNFAAVPWGGPGNERAAEAILRSEQAHPGTLGAAQEGDRTATEALARAVAEALHPRGQAAAGDTTQQPAPAHAEADAPDLPALAPPVAPDPRPDLDLVTKRAYEDYRANGGRLSLDEWLTAGQPKPDSVEARVFTSTDPKVGDIATRIEAALTGSVRSVNIAIGDKNLGLASEADIVLDNGDIVEIKAGGGKGTTKQVVNQQKIIGRSGEIIVYGEKLKG